MLARDVLPISPKLISMPSMASKQMSRVDTPEGSADLVTLAWSARTHCLARYSAYALSSLEMNLDSSRHSSQPHGLRSRIVVRYAGDALEICLALSDNVRFHASWLWSKDDPEKRDVRLE